MGLIRALFRFLFPPVFVISIQDGSVHKRRGRVAAAFLNDCSDVAREAGIISGTIYGVRHRGGVGLEFSSNIPPDCHQRFRNVWGLHRGRG